MKNLSSRGFTLIELLLVLVVAGVLLGIAAPNMAGFAKNHRLTSAANDLLAAIQLARAEAVKQQLPTTMCFSANPSASSPSCDGNGTQGWIVFVDDANPAVAHANDGNSQVDAGEAVLIRHEAIPSSISVVTKPASTSKLVAFGANGFSRSVANSLSGVVMCDERKNKVLSGDTSAARGLLLTVMGRPSVTRSATTIKQDSSLLDNASSGTCVP